MRANGFLERTHAYWFESTDWLEQFKDAKPCVPKQDAENNAAQTAPS
jgi:hypothetical protein